MGVLNVTPDSFSDGGQFIAPERALAQARRMIAEGADIIDIGAESTRPYGAQPIPVEEEQKRLEPVLAAVVALGVPVSIDSMKSAVVAWALDAGAVIANDVWGLQRDGGMAALVAQHRSPIVIMHNRDEADATIDIMKDIAAFFERSLAIAAKAGVPPENIVLDPGIGFGKTMELNWQLLSFTAQVPEHQVMVGYSRKRFLGEHRMVLEPNLDAGEIAIKNGAAYLRVHDVAGHRQLKS